MNLDIKFFENAHHILLVADNSSFANASALYTYILTLHKKVSIQRVSEIESRLSFLPWYDKSRDNVPASAEYIVAVTDDVKALYTFFTANDININKKMATALYSALLMRYDVFVGKDCDSTIFAISSALIANGAEYEKANRAILQSTPLSLFRLKSYMFASMLLREAGTCVHLFVSDDELKASGSNMQGCYAVMKELESLVHIEKILLHKSDEENKIIKTIEGERD